MKLFNLLVGFVLVLFAGTAVAQAPAMNVGLSWQAPTEYTDGSPLPVGDLDFYRVLCGTTSNPSTYPLQHDVPGTATSISRADLVAAFNLQFGTTYFCALRVTAKNGKTSARSAEVSFTLVDERTPGAPTLTVE